MITLSLVEIAKVIGLPDPMGGVVIDSVVTDSRDVQCGSLFAALPGARVDGHDFAQTAVGMGAVALLVSRPLDLNVPELVVDDVLVALGKIATELRHRLNPIVIGITGSNGKTTVKEMLASIMRQQGDVLATSGNYNNELGVPLTLFRLQEKHRFAVLEMGASKPGDITRLTSIAAPDIGLITNIEQAHLEGFGSQEGVARAKGELFCALPESGCAVFNGDLPWSELWLQTNSAGQVLTFGEGEKNDVVIQSGGNRPKLVTSVGQIEVELRLPGKHNLVNAAGAAAAALALQVSLEHIKQGLEVVEPVPGRLGFIHADAGWTVIDDTYNANPASVYSALQVLAGMQGTAWFVLGDMKELGPNSRKLHEQVGKQARALGVNRLFATGEMSSWAVDSFGSDAQHFTRQSDLIDALKAQLRPGINCLVKGSRSMKMEQVVQALLSASVIREVC